jgi:lysozyme family protein
MAVFIVALEHLMAVESREWNNCPYDLGGETDAGWSRVYHPHLPIWEIIDQTKEEMEAAGLVVSKTTLSAKLLDNALLQDTVDAFYEEWFLRLKLDKVNSQYVANMIWQAVIHNGEHEAVKWVQMVCASNGRPVLIDGWLGDKTLDAINSVNADRFVSDMGVMHKQKIIYTISKKPEQIANRLGWERRIEYFLKKT